MQPFVMLHSPPAGRPTWNLQLQQRVAELSDFGAILHHLGQVFKIEAAKEMADGVSLARMFSLRAAYSLSVHARRLFVFLPVYTLSPRIHAVSLFSSLRVLFSLFFASPSHLFLS